MAKEILNEAIEQFKEEQKIRQVENIKKELKKAVNILCDIKEEEEKLGKVFKELGFKLTPKFKDFLSSVKKYEDLVFTAVGSGSYMVGSTTSSSISSSTFSDMFYLDGSSGEVSEVKK